MHTIELSQAARDRIGKRRPSAHVFDSIDPRRTAHLVVDLQNGFMVPGQPAEIATAREIVPNVNRISAALRRAGGLVVYIQNTFDDECIRGWSTYFDHFSNPDYRGRMIQAFTPGDFGHELYADLEVLPGDLKIRKRRYGAFVPGSSDLHDILQARGIDTVIVTGTATNVCCESTARDAMMLNYKTLFVADGNAAHNDAEQNATLSILAISFCDVVTTDEATALIQAGQNPLSQAAE